MLDLTESILQLVRFLLDALPIRLRGIIAVGLFILGSMVVLVIIRGQIGNRPMSVLTQHLITAIDAALILLLAVVVLLIIASAFRAIFYRG